MVHRNAPLSETGRLRLARCVVDEGWPLRRAAERFQVSHATAARWAARYRQAGRRGHGGPVRRGRMPARPAPPGGPSGGSWTCGSPGGWARPGSRFRLGLAPSTVHAVLARYGCPRLAHLDRATGVPVRRYERDRPGELVHVDVKKLGNIPDGGGWRVLGKAHGQHNRQAPPRPGRRRTATTSRSWATATCTPPWMITPGWLTPRSCLTRPRTPPPRSWPARTPGTPPPGSPSNACISDNGSCYRSTTWAATCADAGHHP